MNNIRKVQKNSIRKVHMLGICGMGMSALAILFKESGIKVTGSDEEVFGSAPINLKRNKIPFNTKFDAKNIPKDADLIIMGNNIPLSPEENVEKKRALELGIKIQSMPEALAELSKNTENIVVAGSSGKSSMTGLISWCLVKAKKDPSYFIGATPLDLKNSSHMGKGKEFVIEGDEYTSSKTDQNSKFLHFDPTYVVLTSTLHDHVNIFPTEESYKEPFKKLMEKIHANGLLVYALNRKNNQEIAKYAKCKTISYGLDSDADYSAQNIEYNMQSSFNLMHKGKKIITIKTNLLGKHNIENIVGAGALLLETKKITPEVFAKAIKSFHGIKRRIELKTKKGEVPVYEGFGSSYEKTKSIFDTLKLHFPKKRIVTIFEPHAFSWRNRKFVKWYEDVFDGIDEVIMLPAISHGKMAPDQLTKEEVWEEAKKYREIHIAYDEKGALEMLKKIFTKNDVVALISSGPMLGLTESVPKLVEK